MRAWADHHKTIVILGVRHLAELARWEQRLRDSQTRYAAFAEPDMGGEKTAIAVHPAVDRHLCRNLQLL